MAVHIRLQRRGATHRPFYHLVACDQRSPRDGRFLEKPGYYDPAREPSVINLKEDRIQYWYSQGAQLSNAANTLMRKSNLHLERRPAASAS